MAERQLLEPMSPDSLSSPRVWPCDGGCCNGHKPAMEAASTSRGTVRQRWDVQAEVMP